MKYSIKEIIIHTYLLEEGWGFKPLKPTSRYAISTGRVVCTHKNNLNITT